MTGNDFTDEPFRIPATTFVTGPSTYPEFFRLPVSGPDPYFGLKRSYYYSLEAEGKIRFRRVRRRGCVRGVTLVVGQSVAEFLRSPACE